MLQLNIAWGGRPAGEVLNMEDLNDSQLAKWKFRVSQGKETWVHHDGPIRCAASAV